MKYLLASLFVVMLVACGGGGGSAGTPVGTASAPSAAASSTTGVAGVVTMSLVDSNGATIASQNLSQTQSQFVKVVVTSVAGAPLPLTKVVLTVDATLATIVTSSALTDSQGTATFKIAVASVSASGVVSVKATATVPAATSTSSAAGTTDVSSTLNLSISVGSVSIATLTVNPTTAQRGQSVTATANVLVNGQPASSNAVSVQFNSNCGVPSPTSAVVDANGKATTVVKTATEGDCTVTASVNGKSVTTGFTVSLPPITGVQFVSATPAVIYQQGSPGGSTSIVQFKVIDSLGASVPGVAVAASLTNLDGGINFCNSPDTATTAPDGTVSFSVCAGTIPTTVQVKAALVSTPSVTTISNILAIQTGLPTQRFFSISASQQNFFVGAGKSAKFDGGKVTINIFAADRQGNPVPNGTPISFVTEGGQINSAGQSSCVIKDGGCSVSLIGQEYRPWGASVGDTRPGRVTVLAFADGEESFIDQNNNNRYDPGELFEDLGVMFMDKNENGAFDAAYTNLLANTNEGEQTYPIPVSAMGSVACSANANIGLSVANTCNGVWDGHTKVRRSILVVFSGDAVALPSEYDASIPVGTRTAIVSQSKGSVTVRLADINGNPLPAGSTVAVVVEKLSSTDTCTASLTFGGPTLPSTTEPTLASAGLFQNCNDGLTRTLDFQVTVGAKTTGLPVSFTIAP